MIARRRRPARQTPEQILDRLEAVRQAHGAPRLEARGPRRRLLGGRIHDAVVLRPDARAHDPEASALRGCPAVAEIRAALADHPGLLAWTDHAGRAWIDPARGAGALAAGLPKAWPRDTGRAAAGIPDGIRRLAVGPLSAHERLALGGPVLLCESLPDLLGYVPGLAPADPAGFCVRAGDLLAIAIGRDPEALFLLPLHRIP